MTTYNIDVRFKSAAVKKSPRVLEVAEAFGLVLSEREFVVFDNVKLDVNQGDVVYITGQSGGGKSSLLRELSRQMKEEGKKVFNIEDVVLLPEPLIEQIGETTNKGMTNLSSAGINDADLVIKMPSELSDGQRYRFRLAKLIESGADVWVADEFLAILDRDTAKVIAFAIQKLARMAGATLIVATTHQDMVDDLAPDLYIDKRYRDKVAIKENKYEICSVCGGRHLPETD